MKICSSIKVVELSGSTELAGAASGAAWFGSARTWVDSVEPGLHAIDFEGVRLATVSWLREAVLATAKYAATMRPDVMFIAANLSELVREEFVVALDATSSVMVAVELSSDLRVQNPVVLGRLDPALTETLRVVQHMHEFDASFVSRAVPRLALSAANNRLAAIEAKGILRSERRGRGRVYRPLLENLHYGQ